VDTFLDNARRILDVAHAHSGDPAGDFAVLIRPDGGLHILMESAFTLEAAAADAGARIAYSVTRSAEGIKVHGLMPGRECTLHEKNPCRELLPDRPLYRITSPS
jgi:hypothetical protein